MNELKLVYDKELIDNLKERISAVYPEEVLSITSVLESDPQDDSIWFTVRYSEPWWLVRLGWEMQDIKHYNKI
ncbi:MAG: hypothetical protein SOX26_01440 [Phocaeicola sp.]|nr:hypothetical protein [Phocaeicola sp.]